MAKKINSRMKGKNGELEISKILREHGFSEARRSQQYAGTNNDADVIGLPGIHVEVKRVERLQLENAMEQSIRDARPGEIPVVMHRKNRKPWLVTMELERWLELYKNQIPF